MGFIEFHNADPEKVIDLPGEADDGNPSMASPRTHLLRVLRGALSNAPTWWSSAELDLAAGVAALDEASGDALARWLQRTRVVFRRRELELTDDQLRTLEAFGWLAPVLPAEQPVAVLATITLDELALSGSRAEVERSVLADPQRLAGLARYGPFAWIPERARRWFALARLAAFASDDDLSLLARIDLGQIVPPAGSPLAQTCAGERVHLLGTLPWASRSAAEDYLAAREARATRSAQPPAVIFRRALAEVEARAGQPLHLGWHYLSAAHHWTRLLAECVAECVAEQALPLAQQRAARRALRRAPCSPALARQVWEELHAAWSPRPMADRLARAFGTWQLWSEVERAAWTARARGERVRRQNVWSTRTFDAWLDHGGVRVVADGESVEALALRRLAGDGWQGLHAEGGFWLAVAYLVLDLHPAGPLPWCAPLQATPLDWGRWGYGARRHRPLRAAAAALIRDRESALAAALRRAHEPLPGFMSAPSPEALTAVLRHLPLRVLVPLLLRVLDAPHEAGGLPDLVVWKDNTVAFWEVKSPSDQLSAKQRRWLAWLVSEGVPAGVLRIVARTPVQTSLLSAARRTPAAAMPTTTRPRRSPGSTSGETTFQLLLGGAVWQPLPGSPVPDGTPGAELRHVAGKPWRDVRSELPFVDDVLVPIPVAAVLAIVRDGRRTVLRRWFPLPAGLVLVAAVREEVLPEGGMGPCIRILTRRAGWLIPASLSRHEPVVARPAELADPTRDWVPHPDLPPPRAEHLAAAWGCADELADQLLLVGAEPHGVWIEAQRLVIATDPTRAVLWTARDPRLVPGLLPINR